jgi:hypothetical protein
MWVTTDNRICENQFVSWIEVNLYVGKDFMIQVENTYRIPLCWL